MFRKILVVLSCMIILMSCVVPCFAVGSGAYKFAPLQFDFVTSSAGNTAWMFNEFGTAKGDFSDAVYSASYLCTSGLTTADVELYAGTKFRLYSRRQIVAVDDLSGYGFWPGLDAELSGSVSIQFSLIELVSVDNRWRERSTYVSGNYALRPDEFFDLGARIGSLIREKTNLTYVRIDNLCVDVNLISENNACCLDFDIPLGTNPNANYAAWFDAFGVKSVFVDDVYYDEVPYDAMGWLKMVVNSLWDLEITPNFTLGTWVNVIVGALVVVVILKLFGGK